MSFNAKKSSEEKFAEEERLEETEEERRRRLEERKKKRGNYARPRIGDSKPKRYHNKRKKIDTRKY